MRDGMEKENDILGQMLKLPVLRVFAPFYWKHKEILLYLFFGGLTFIISVTSFALFDSILQNELLANVLSWLFAVSFAYITNRNYVFSPTPGDRTRQYKQILEFAAARLMTLFLEEGILFVFITKLAFNKIAVKIAAQVIVIAVNYLLSKLYIFKRK